MVTPLFRGCATALVTPFDHSGALDEGALVRLIEFQQQAGVSAIVILGTTGEPCTITSSERARIIELTLMHAQGLPVIVGTGSNDTRCAIEHARQAKALGAHGQLCVTPYYNKASQTGLIRHYETIADLSGLPMILYHVPSRTGVSITPETLSRLSRHPMIVGIKEAGSDMHLSARMFENTGENFAVYAGNDDLVLPLMAQGAAGAISVVSNILPAMMVRLLDACMDGRFAQAQNLQLALLPVIRALFAQVNPIPVKAALAMMGMIKESLRLPLTPLEEPHRTQLADILIAMKLVRDE